MRKIVVRVVVGVVLLAALVIFGIPVLIGFRHYDGDLPSCPNATPEFFQQAVIDHFVRNKRGADDIEFIPGSFYDDQLSTIAFRKGGREYYAIVDCRGGLELSAKD